MISRYSTTDIVADKYKQTIYPDIPVVLGDIYIESKRGDRLDLLAAKYLKDARLWYIIAIANNLGKGAFFVTPGIRLRIPNNTSVSQYNV
jgi:hypothetical protein